MTDTSQLRQLAVDLGEAGARAVDTAANELEAAGLRIRDDLRKQARGHPSFKHFPQAITYDVRGLTAEVGPDKQRKQGALGNILYFGTSRNGPVLPDPAAALLRDYPRFARDLARALAAGAL